MMWIKYNKSTYTPRVYDNEISKVLSSSTEVGSESRNQGSPVRFQENILYLELT